MIKIYVFCTRIFSVIFLKKISRPPLFATYFFYIILLLITLQFATYIIDPKKSKNCTANPQISFSPLQTFYKNTLVGVKYGTYVENDTVMPPKLLIIVIKIIASLSIISNYY